VVGRNAFGQSKPDLFVERFERILRTTGGWTIIFDCAAAIAGTRPVEGDRRAAAPIA
jgi:hypothetical protein